MFKGKYHQNLSHRIMVGDIYRTLAWHEAISQAIQPDDVVVDFGAGSGILSLFALQHGAKHVYCIERKSSTRDLCRELLEDNGYNNDQFTICESYTEVLSLIKKCDVVLSESIGDHLIENISMKIFLNLCKQLQPRTALPERMSLYCYPEIVVRRSKNLNNIEQKLNISLEKLKNPDLPNDLLDVAYFEGGENSDYYWWINNFYSIDKGECIVDYLSHPLYFYHNKIEDDQITKILEINTESQKSYGLLLYWKTIIYGDVVITNHPTRNENKSHSYYQRVVELQNPSLKPKNKIILTIDMNYDDRINEDQPCRNLQIKIL